MREGERAKLWEMVIFGLFGYSADGSTDRETVMRLVIEARLEGEDIEDASNPITLAVIDRHDDVLEEFGLSLAEGQELLAATQSALVRSQASVWVNTQDYCHGCYTPLRKKDNRSIRGGPIC